MANCRGQSLVGLLVTSAIMATVFMAFLGMFKIQSKASRNIAAHGGITDLANAADLLFSSPQCAAIGSYLLGGTGTTVTIGAGTYGLAVDTISFANGSPVITVLPNPAITNMISPYSIVSLQMIPLGGNGPFGAGFKYPFHMVVGFGSDPGSPPPLPLNKFIMVYTNAAKQVLGACNSGAQPNSVVAYNELNNTGGVLSTTINVPAPKGLVILTGYAGGTCVSAVPTDAGVFAHTTIDGVVCTSSEAFEGLSSSISFGATATCMKVLTPGNHVLGATNSYYGSYPCMSGYQLKLQYTLLNASGL